MIYRPNYFIKEGIRNVYSNGLMSIASIFVMVCCLLLMGVSFLASRSIKNILKNIEKNNSITVYAKFDVPVNTDELKSRISLLENVSSCEVRSKEEALKGYEETLGSSLTDLFDGEVPVPDTFEVSMNDLSKYHETVSAILEIPEVDSISDRSEIASKLSNLKSILKKVGFWITVGLVSVSIMIISNTIRITMYNRRFEISIMKSIGATNTFIRLPFIIEGMILGLISSIISILILKFTYMKASELFSNFIPNSITSFNQIYVQIFASFILFGVFLGIISSLLSIKKYLKQEGGLSVVW